MKLRPHYILFVILLTLGSLVQQALPTLACPAESEPSINSVKTKPASYTHVIPKGTTYYLQGPQQAMPPQGSFKPGTRVIIIQEMGSYTRVKSEEGIEASVSTESLQKMK